MKMDIGKKKGMKINTKHSSLSHINDGPSSFLCHSK